MVENNKLKKELQESKAIIEASNKDGRGKKNT